MCRQFGAQHQFPPPPSERSTPLTAGGSSALRFQALRAFHGLRPDTPGSAPPCPFRVGLTPRQALRRCCGPLGCSLQEAFDARLQRQAFPPDVASLLPGSLATTWTGLAPAGGDELTGYALSDYPAHLHPVLMRVPSGHAVAAPAGQVPVEQLDPLLYADALGSRGQFPHSLVHPLQSLGGDPDTDLAIATVESEAQDCGLVGVLDRRFLRIHLQLQPPRDEPGDPSQYPLTRPLAPYVDPSVHHPVRDVQKPP
jgi:hypothetical protein